MSDKPLFPEQYRRPDPPRPEPEEGEGE